MKTGTIIRTFRARDGRDLVLRVVNWNDLDDLLELINALVDERANIIIDEKVTREEEIEWLSQRLARLEKDEALYLVAEANGKVVARQNSTGGRGATTGTWLR